MPFYPGRLQFLRAIIVILVGVSITKNSFADSQVKICKSGLSAHYALLNSVDDKGGIWRQFQADASLRQDSSDALQLDRDIKSLAHSLLYLCDTLNGVPLNDLALFVSRALEKQGEAEFRRQQKILGNTRKEVDLWIRFARFAKSIENRQLKMESVEQTFKDALVLYEDYAHLSASLETDSGPKDPLASVRKLIKRIREFSSSDPNIKMALHENAQVPFWDVDENYGGS